ncbi:MAG: 1-deoxy-D-xylulose-5-phosphate reductoisomerase [Fibrobacterota bacterium]
MKVLLLGSTGSIGASACNCILRYPHRFELVGLSANNNVDILLMQIERFKPHAVCVASSRGARKIGDNLPEDVTLYEGEKGLEKMVQQLDYDILLNALVGAVGLRPTVAALKRGKRVALANKESLVIGGDLINELIEQGNGSLIPIDSEHSAILQCLNGESQKSVEKITLTASGGPFRELPGEQFAAVTPQQALDHPTWSMGNKITIDSATLMNKGFELIEAHHLFDIPYSQLDVVVHPQSIIHSMVVFDDGAVIAQAGLPDMELPIQYALSYPDRLPIASSRLDLAKIGSLTFSAPDTSRFPCLNLCIKAGENGGAYPIILNAANEIAVESFLIGAISFTDIPRLIDSALQEFTNSRITSVEEIEHIDRISREQTRKRIA